VPHLQGSISHSILQDPLTFTAKRALRVAWMNSNG
jgi:hypothetical protein